MSSMRSLRTLRVALSYCSSQIVRKPYPKYLRSTEYGVVLTCLEFLLFGNLAAKTYYPLALQTQLTKISSVKVGTCSPLSAAGSNRMLPHTSYLLLITYDAVECIIKGADKAQLE